MTTLREAAQQALEAMQSFESGTNGLYKGEFAEEIAALRAALAEPWAHVSHVQSEEETYGERAHGIGDST